MGRSAYRTLESGVHKGDRVRFETSSRSPKSWYLVRDVPSRMADPGWAYQLPDVESWAHLLGKRGGEYVITWDRSYPGPEYETWLYRLDDGLGDRTRLTGVKVDPAPSRKPPYLADYLPDPHMVEAWPHV